MYIIIDGGKDMNNKTNQNKIVEARGLAGQHVKISLNQPKQHLFSDEYNVEFVEAGNKGILKSDTLKIVLGKKEYNRVRLETRGI